MKKADVRFTSGVGGTEYQHPSWWAFDEEGFAIGGPATSKRELQQELATKNRLVHSGRYSSRPLYTAY